MFQLNQRHKDTAQRTFEFELPDFLAQKGPCFLKIKAKPYSECERVMKLTNERLMTNVKAQAKVLEERLENRLAGVKDIYDMADPVVSEARRFHAEGDILAQNQFHRDMSIGIIKTCVVSWETNIYDNESKGVVEPTEENFSALAAMAFPEAVISDLPDLGVMFQAMRDDILDPTEQRAADAVQETSEKN